MKAFGIVVLVIVGGFLMIMMIGSATSPPGYSEWRDKKERLEAFCKNAMSDSALGAERRQTREMCDGFEARIESERPRR